MSFEKLEIDNYKKYFLDIKKELIIFENNERLLVFLKYIEKTIEYMNVNTINIEPINIIEKNNQKYTVLQKQDFEEKRKKKQEKIKENIINEAKKVKYLSMQFVSFLKKIKITKNKKEIILIEEQTNDVFKQIEKIKKK